MTVTAWFARQLSLTACAGDVLQRTVDPAQHLRLRVSRHALRRALRHTPAEEVRRRDALRGASTARTLASPVFALADVLLGTGRPRSLHGAPRAACRSPLRRGGMARLDAPAVRALCTHRAARLRGATL